MDRKPLDGRVAVVTGSSNGLGKAIAVSLGSDGANLALVSRDIDALSTAAEQAGATGNPVLSGQAMETRIDLLENERTWVIGLSSGLGIGIAIIVWLRRDIVRTLVQEAFPKDTLWDQKRLNTWRPNPGSGR